MKYSSIILSIIFLMITGSCKKFISSDAPSNQLMAGAVFEDEATANAAVIGIYSRMMSSGFISGTTNLTILCGFSADELITYSASGTNVEFYTNSLASTSISTLWNIPYQYIFTANSVIEGLDKSTKIGKNIKDQLLGEVLFIRAFCYFYLVNLYGDVPYHTTTDYQLNNVQPRTSKDIVYQNIIKDLILAKSLLSNDYTYTSNERIRPNKFAAAALLARTYLFNNNWALADAEATSIIENTTLFDLSSVGLSSAFLKNNKESIWQLMPVKPGFNTDDGQYLILTATPTIASLSESQYNSFEVGDPRKTLWVGNITVGGKTYYFPHKYKVKTGTALTEYYTVFRLAEQYLIRAESRAQQNRIADAVSDINIVRKRARGSSTTVLPDVLSSISQEECLNAILKERRSELFTEWGHRWLDLKRTNQAGIVLKPLKGSNWQETDVFYPIPNAQMLNNPSMVQNDGYN